MVSDSSDHLYSWHKRAAYLSRRQFAVLVAAILVAAETISASTYPKQIPYNNNRHYYTSKSRPSSSPLYFSEDEYEERILSALAEIEDNEGNYEEGTSTTATTDHHSQVTGRSKSNKRRPKNDKTQKQWIQDWASSSYEEDSSQSDEFSIILQRSKEWKRKTKWSSSGSSRSQGIQHSKKAFNTTSGENTGKELQVSKSLSLTQDDKIKAEAVSKAEQTETKNFDSKNVKSSDAPLREQSDNPQTHSSASLAPPSGTQAPTELKNIPTNKAYSPCGYTKLYAPHNQTQTASLPGSQQQELVQTTSSAPSVPQPQHEHQQQPRLVSQATHMYHQPSDQKIHEKQNYKKMFKHHPTNMPLTTNDSSITPWVKKFISSRHKDALVPVPRDYLMDNFNLVRLAPVVEKIASMKQKDLELSTASPNLEQQIASRATSKQGGRASQQQQSNQHPYALYKEALELIVKQEETEEEPSLIVQYAAEVLYSLVHARFVVSPRGLEAIRRRLRLYANSIPLFGRCPKLSCGGMPLLPCGLSDDYDVSGEGGVGGRNRAKRYCCSCHETIHCWESKVDGSAWGTSVCHLLLMVYGQEELFPSHFMTPYSLAASVEATDPLNGDAANKSSKSYGHIFGFPVHPAVAMSQSNHHFM